MEHASRRSAAILASREVLGTYVVLVGLLVLTATTRIRILQIPGYLLMVGFDLLQNPLVPGLGGFAFWTVFAVYLYVLAVALGGIVRLFGGVT